MRCSQCGESLIAPAERCPACDAPLDDAAVDTPPADTVTAPMAAALPPPPRPIVPPPTSRPAPPAIPEPGPAALASDPPAAALVPAQRARPATPVSESGGVPAVGRLGLFSHRPAGYSSAGWWLMAGIGRDWRATVAALIGGWFGLPVAIALAVVGAVVGGIIGLVGGAAAAGEALEEVPVVGEVLAQFSTLGGGGLGALGGIVLGTLSGFAGGLLAPWLVDYLDDPVVTVIVILLNVVLGLLVGVLYTIYGTVLEPWRLRLGGARRMSRREEEFLLPILHECGQRMGLANLPRLLIDDGRVPNAFAHTRHIVVQRGLLLEFEYDREAVAGVLSHELAHWHNADAVAGLFVRGVALPLYIAHRAATLVLRIFDNSIVRFLAIAVAWPVLVSVRYFIVPLQSASARVAEYRADQGAVLAGHRDGLRLVLGRLRRSVDGSRNGWDEAICASHPPAELRLEALEREGVDYPLVPARR